MNRTGAMASVCFCAGLLAALSAGFAFQLLDGMGLDRLAEGGLTTQWLPPGLCSRLLHGGLWGLAFFITVAGPRARNRWIRKGLWTSLLPTAWQLFYVFPNRTPYGALGLGLGHLTPLAVLCFNLAWGLFTGFFARLLWGRS